MFNADQTPAQLAEQQAQVAAQQAKVAADQAAQLQKQIEQTTQQAIDNALRDGQVSGNSRLELKEQIRAAIDAARDAQAARNPPFPRGVQWTPGMVPPRNDDIPERLPEVLGIMGLTLVCCVVGFPIARAIGRWIDRRGTTPPAAPREVVMRLEAIEQAVESVAVEVERISEGQRFTARVLSERTHEAAPDFAAARESVPAGIPANARRS